MYIYSLHYKAIKSNNKTAIQLQKNVLQVKDYINWKRLLKSTRNLSRHHQQLRQTIFFVLNEFMFKFQSIRMKIHFEIKARKCLNAIILLHTTFKCSKKQNVAKRN